MDASNYDISDSIELESGNMLSFSDSDRPTICSPSHEALINGNGFRYFRTWLLGSSWGLDELLNGHLTLNARRPLCSISFPIQYKECPREVFLDRLSNCQVRQQLGQLEKKE